MTSNKIDNLFLLEFKVAANFYSISFISILFSYKARLFG